MMIFKLFSRKNNASFSRRQVLRLSAVMMMIGVAAGAYTFYTAAPVVNDVVTYFNDLGTVTVSASSTPAAPTAQEEKIDRYAAEIYEERQEAYQRDARLRAIDKMEAELEAEKETIREVELMDGGQSFQ